MSETRIARTSDDVRTALLRAVRDFAQREVAPLVEQYDRDERLPAHILQQLGALGFCGGTVPEEWGGTGLDHVTFAAIIEEISVVDHVLGVLMSMPSALVGSALLHFGTDEQRRQWLEPLAKGEIFGAAGVTEPQSGTDVAAMQTKYTKDGDDYIISGAKTWISNLDIASFFVTFATSQPRSRQKNCISAFLIPRDTVGISVHPFHNKLGFRPICTGELVLDDVRVPKEALIGEEGGGFAVAMNAVERGRLAVASRAVGLARSCLEASITYAHDRTVFGNPIAHYQLIRGKVADMATEIEAARLLVNRCAEALDQAKPVRVEASMAKMYASDVAQRVATEAVQIHGAYGTSSEYLVSRAYRDAKVFQIVEGTNELHRLLIASAVMDATGQR